MKQRFIIYLAPILLIPAFLFAALVPDRTSASMIQTSRKTIVQAQLSLEESLNDLSKIFGVKIEIAGKQEKALCKFNLNMRGTNLEGAVKEAIRKAGIQNHAMVWDKTGKILRILIFEAGRRGITNENKHGNPTTNISISGDMSPLTQEQIYLLAQQGAALETEMEESMKPLTTEQMQHLKRQSAELETEMKEGAKPLTADQIAQLQEQSAKLETEMEEGMKPLATEQMQHLKRQSAELETEMKEGAKPLTADQIEQLQEQNTEIEMEMESENSQQQSLSKEKMLLLEK